MHIYSVRLNEWQLREKVDDCTSYTFLHNTLLLQLMFEKLDGKIFSSSFAVWFNRTLMFGSICTLGHFRYGRVSLGCDLDSLKRFEMFVAVPFPRRLANLSLEV